MRKQKIFALFCFVISIIFSIFNANITGAAIGIRSSSISLAALVFFMFGLIFTFYDSRSDREKIKELVEQYETGKISPIEAIININGITPISSVKFKSGLQHTIVGERDSFSIPLRKGKKAEELAILEYLVAIRNHTEIRRDNELHFDKGVSTKHYSEGIKKLIENVKRKYAPDLQTKLGII